MTPLRTKRLILRNWEERDRDLFHRINSDDRVMEFFPKRRSRAESDAMMDDIRADIVDEGFGWFAAEIAETAHCIGFVGLNRADIAPIAQPQALEIGWRLAPEFWGKGFASEGASRLLDFAFDDLDQDSIISFAVVHNRRSTAVMERLGMRFERTFLHPRVPETHPQLQRHALHAITRSEWKARSGLKTK